MFTLFLLTIKYQTNGSTQFHTRAKTIWKEENKKALHTQFTKKNTALLLGIAYCDSNVHLSRIIHLPLKKTKHPFIYYITVFLVNFICSRKWWLPCVISHPPFNNLNGIVPEMNDKAVLFMTSQSQPPESWCQTEDLVCRASMQLAHVTHAQLGAAQMQSLHD